MKSRDLEKLALVSLIALIAIMQGQNGFLLPQEPRLANPNDVVVKGNTTANSEKERECLVPEKFFRMATLSSNRVSEVAPCQISKSDPLIEALGLREGDAVLAINRSIVHGRKELISQLLEAITQKEFTITVVREKRVKKLVVGAKECSKKLRTLLAKTGIKEEDFAVSSFDFSGH